MQSCNFSIASSASHYDEPRLKLKFDIFLSKLEHAIENNAINDTFYNWILLGINRLCKYRDMFPECVSDLAIKFLDVLIHSRQMSRLSQQKIQYTQCIENITKQVIFLLTKKTNIQQKITFLQNWITLLAFINDKECLENIMIQNDLIMKQLFNYIFESGHYTTQFFTLHLIIKYLKSTNLNVQSRILEEVLDNKLTILKEILLNFDLKEKPEGDYRNFLNIFNFELSDKQKIYSYSPIESNLGSLTISKKNNFWINFNLDTNTLSFFLLTKDLNITENLYTDTIICEYDIRTITLCESTFSMMVEINSNANIIPRSILNYVNLNLNSLNFYFSLNDFNLIQKIKWDDFKIKVISEPSKKMEKQNNIKLAQKKKKSHRNFYVPETTSVDSFDEKCSNNESIIEGTSSGTSKQNKFKLNNFKKVSYKKNITRNIIKEEKNEISEKKSKADSTKISKPDQTACADNTNKIIENSIDGLSIFNKSKTQNLGKKPRTKKDKSLNLSLQSAKTEVKTYSLRNLQDVKHKQTSEHQHVLEFKLPPVRKMSSNSKVAESYTTDEPNKQLINLVRPLQVPEDASTLLPDNQNKVQLAIEEYSTHLKRSNRKYSTEEINVSKKNMKNMNQALERATKITENKKYDDNVYDIMNILKDSPKKRITRQSIIKNLKSNQKNIDYKNKSKLVKRLRKSVKQEEKATKSNCSLPDSQPEPMVVVADVHVPEIEKIKSNRSKKGEKAEKVKITMPQNVTDKLNMGLEKIEYDIDSVIVTISSSQVDEKSMETKNLQSPVSSEILTKTIASIPSFPIINYDQEIFPNPSQCRTIKKNWLLNKFFKDVEIYVKDASQDLPDADGSVVIASNNNENIIFCELQVPGVPNGSDVLNKDVVPNKPNISNEPNVSNKPNLLKKPNIPGKDDKSDKTHLPDEFDVANIANRFQISDVPNVIRRAEKEIKEIDLSAISSDLHYNRYSFDQNKQRKSHNSDKTYIIENEFDFLKHSIENENNPNIDDKSDKTHDKFDVANIANRFEISDIPNVIRHAEKEIKEIDLSVISSEFHYNRYNFEKNKQEKSINSDKTYIIENEFDFLKHSTQNKNESNLNYGSLKKNSIESSETFLTPVNKRKDDVVEIIQTETFKINNGNRTEEVIHSYKRKIIDDRSGVELKIPKLNKENYNVSETANISNNKNSILNDLLHKYKETLVLKANEISDVYGQSIYINNFDELQANIQNYFQNIVDIKKSLETNKKNIEDIRNKLHEKEDERKKLIVKRDENFEKILRILKEIDTYYEDNKYRFEMEYKKSILEFNQSSIEIRNQIWQDYLDQIIKSFVESLGHHYTFDSES